MYWKDKYKTKMVMLDATRAGRRRRHKKAVIIAPVGSGRRRRGGRRHHRGKGIISGGIGLIQRLASTVGLGRRRRGRGGVMPYAGRRRRH